MAALVIVSFLWAFSFGLIRRYLVQLDSSAVAWMRLALSLGAFLPWLRFRVLALGSLVRVLVIGALQFGLMYLLYLEAFRYLKAYQVAVLTLVTPVFVCLFDALLERRFSPLALSSAVLAALGAMIVVAAQPLGHAEWRGILLVQGSNASFALGQLLYRKIRLRYPDVPDRMLMPWLYVGATLIASPFAASKVFETLEILSVVQGLVICYLGVIASGLGFYLWNKGAVQVSASSLSVMNNLKIPLGVLVSLLVFGEKAHTVRLALGAAIIAAAAWVAERDARDPRRVPT